MATNSDNVFSYLDVEVSGQAKDPSSNQENESSSDSASPPQEDDQNSNAKSKKGLSVGAIVGIVVAVVVVLVAVSVGIFMYFRRKNIYEHSTNAEEEGNRAYQEDPFDPF